MRLSMPTAIALFLASTTSGCLGFSELAEESGWIGGERREARAKQRAERGKWAFDLEDGIRSNDFARAETLIKSRPRFYAPRSGGTSGSDKARGYDIQNEIAINRMILHGRAYESGARDPNGYCDLHRTLQNGVQIGIPYVFKTSLRQYVADRCNEIAAEIADAARREKKERRAAEKAARDERDAQNRAAAAAKAAKAAEAQRLHDLDPVVIAGRANEKASREMILAVHTAGDSECYALPPQYMSVCFRTNNQGLNQALGSVMVSGPDPGRVQRVINACSTDPGISADRARRPQVSPAILLGCISTTYGMGTIK